MSPPEFRLNHEVVETPPRPSATVLLLRDGARGLEILMQRRHDDTDAFGGAYVFPGGKVDREDSDDDMLERIDVPSEALHATLGDPEIGQAMAAAFYVAAARETFEEAGVLLATMVDGAPVGPMQAELARRLSREGYAFIEVLESLKLRLTVSTLMAWSRWVTPKMPSVTRKRFDSRFFLARAPAGQVATHDNHEATDSVWLNPRQAIAMYGAGEIMLAAPQLMSLVELAAHGGVEAAMRPQAHRWPRRIDPQPFEYEGARGVAYPGDERHSDPERAMPGPTCLIFRNGRFEPIEGLASLLAGG